MSLFVVPILFFVLSGTPAVLAADPDDYRQTLQAALADLDRGTTIDVERAIARLRSIDSVTLPDGTVVQVDNAAVLADLEAPRPAVESARTRLLALLIELDRATQPTDASEVSRAQTSLQRVLDRAEFRPQPPPNPVVRFIRSIQNAIQEWLDQIFARVPAGPELSPSLRTVLEGIGLLVVAALLVWVVLRFRRELGPSVSAVVVDRAAQRMTSEEARAEAERLARAGAYRAAARAIYLAVLLYWDEQGRLRFDRSLTNQEVLAKARALGDDALVARLAPLVDRFDRIWYGGIAPSPEDYAGFARLANRAWDGV